MDLTCKYCNKIYSSYQSRCNHIRKYHKVTDHIDVYNVHNVHKKNTILVQESVDSVHILSTKNYICKFCNKELCNRKSRWRHEQLCKEKYNITNDSKENNLEIKELKNEIKELKNIILSSIKIHPSKLKKINNQLINNTNI